MWCDLRLGRVAVSDPGLPSLRPPSRSSRSCQERCCDLLSECGYGAGLLVGCIMPRFRQREGRDDALRPGGLGERVDGYSQYNLLPGEFLDGVDGIGIEITIDFTRIDTFCLHYLLEFIAKLFRPLF